MIRPIARVIPLLLLLVMLLPAAAPAASPPGADRDGPAPVRLRAGDPAVRHGGPVGADKARVDTVLVLGGPDRQDGRFETTGGAPDWHGWTHRDVTAGDGQVHWQVSDQDPLAGQYSLWCGTYYDGDPGYGNDWHQLLVFTHAVAAPGAQVTVAWTGLLRTDTEPGYDFVHLEVNRGGIWQELAAYDGAQEVAIDQTLILEASELVGDQQDQVQLRVRVDTDASWSDEDGLWDSDGAAWLDDLLVRIDGEVVSSEDLEDQDPGPWQAPTDPQGVGDFAALWDNLLDLDPCRSNFSVQVAFVDDGEVVPGTGGTECITWCYGPGGYIVNNTGGLLGPDFALHNLVESPVLDWPAGHDGARLSFDVYRHELFAGPQWPGIFFTWGVRSTADPVGDPLADQPYRDWSFLYYGGPDYVRLDELVGDLLEPGAVQVQVALRVYELGWIWDIEGTDGTPAPYFDNVAVRAWRYGGPQISVPAFALPNDGFPEQGALDLENLASNSVRFDMARNISPSDHLRIDPGDSVVANVAVMRAGAELIRPPRLVVRMRANPLFDAVRTLPPGFSRDGDVVTGWVAGDTARTAGGAPITGRWAFDLPDTGFFYPGDELRFCLEAGDILAGQDRWTILPADTSGFADFSSPIRWDPDFTVRALPSVTDAGGSMPRLLVWDDAGRGRRDRKLWWFSLANLGYLPGRDYDLFTTRSPSSAVGNGLGARATLALMERYHDLLYTAGDQSTHLLGNGDHDTAPSPDLQLLGAWLDLPDRDAAFFGDDLYTGIASSGAPGAAFVQDRLGAEIVHDDVTQLIALQYAPLIRTVPGPWAPAEPPEWIAAGGCPRLARFDAVVPVAPAVRVAEFTSPSGEDGVYPYAAMLARGDQPTASVVYSAAHDLLRVRDAPGWEPPAFPGPVPARVVLLQDLLWRLGAQPSGPPVGSPQPASGLALAAAPNPFNPRTTIALDLPRAAEVSLRIYDLRGALVRTLVAGHRPAGQHAVVWDGQDGGGRPVASGVYFAEVRADHERRLQKLTLVR